MRNKFRNTQVCFQIVPPLVFREIRFGSDQYRCALALRNDVLRAPLGLPLSADDLQGEADQLHFALFTDVGELVGCVLAVMITDHHARIRQTAISPAYQHQGLGRRIMTELETALAARNITSLTLHARSMTAGFYEKMGYEREGGEFIEVTIPHQRMVKSLA